jgi:thiamine biosynthesis lipoprotein ApbE
MIGATSFGYWKGCFQAMGSPCELLVDTTDGAIAREALALALGEVTRIEQKYSRFRDDSLVAQLNGGKGSPVVLDDETAALIDLADGLHERSDGRFDITCGLLGRAWSFDGRPCEPKAELIASLLERVGWSKVTWESPQLWLPDGMEIDLGGIGKEYAADRVAGLLVKCGWDALVNLGGDVVATGPRQSGDPWLVGVASVTPMEDGMPRPTSFSPAPWPPVGTPIATSSSTVSDGDTFSTRVPAGRWRTLLARYRSARRPAPPPEPWPSSPCSKGWMPTVFWPNKE